MATDEWTFNVTIEHPDGTSVYVSMTVPTGIANDWRHRAQHTDSLPRNAPEPVLECSELAQMGAVRAMASYAASKASNESRELPF